MKDSGQEQASGRFVPGLVVFEQQALSYPLGEKMRETFSAMGIPQTVLAPRERLPAGRDMTEPQKYLGAKRTLVVGVRRTLDFQSCKPSAHYQLPLATSCPGACSYCYLLTTLGKRPYVRVYVNVEEILQKAADYVQKRLPEETVFEGAATSDPVPVERYTGTLLKAIEFFSGMDHARFRFVTKFADVSPFLEARHEGRTEVRFSVNAEAVARRYEARVPPVAARIEAAARVAAHGFPTGFMVAPIIVGEGWKEAYEELFSALGSAAREEPRLGRATLEFVTHRYTVRARRRICEVFPDRAPPMEDESRTFKFGQFGYGKYVYPPGTMAEIKSFLESMVASYLPSAHWLYLV
jgi:spore photoproduct lyase